MERSFKKEVESLRLGEGEVFQGEGILAVTKALLQSGVSYVGGYQGAPISHLMDVLADAQEILDELGVHFEPCASEATAAAMLAASIHYPIRGAVTWKSTVGTNVASDALGNLASAGVNGGAMVILGEDYGEGASIMQERSHAFAMKSAIWLLDPRPNLPSIVRAVEKGFELSEASRTPVMLELRIRACHLWGRFAAEDNRAPDVSRRRKIEHPVLDPGKIILPPATYEQEQDKYQRRLPAALRFIAGEGLNETFPGEHGEVGIILQGGLYNTVLRSLAQLGLADAFGASKVPLQVLNVTYPLVPEEIVRFCEGKEAVLMVEEGQPDFLEQAVAAILRKARCDTELLGKDVLPMAGEYTSEVMLAGLADFFRRHPPAGLDVDGVSRRAEELVALEEKGGELLGEPVPQRPPTFCIGCPERPVFSAMKVVERELGPTHVSADIGCHSFATHAPFHLGQTIMGYGLGLAASRGVSPSFGKRVISVMGDGGLWHNGLSSGVGNSVFNQDDSILVILDNGYAAATGGQYLPSSRTGYHGGPAGMSIQDALRGLGVEWLRTIYSYSVEEIADALREAAGSDEKGLKVIVAEGECQLIRQRRVKRREKAALGEGERVQNERFGVDEDLCTGDHSCIRLNGCPSLTIKDNPDPLRTDPVAHVDDGCVGCGLCGEVAHAARLCPSFYRTEVVTHPSLGERLLDGVRRRVIGMLQAA